MNSDIVPSPFTEPLYIIIVTMSVISFMLGGIIIVRSLLMKKKLSSTSTMILHLIFITVIQTISYSLNWVYNEDLVPRFGGTMCTIQAFFMIVSTLSQELWLSVITVSTFIMFKSDKRSSAVISCKQLTVFIILCDIFPLVWGSFYALKGYLGANYINCWLKKDKNSKENYYVKGFALYINKWVNFTITIFFSLKILRQFNKYDISDERARKGAKSLIIRVFIFPAIKIIGSIIPTIYTILTALDKEVSFLSIPMLICGASFGVLFPITYISFKNVRKELFSYDKTDSIDLSLSITSLYSRSDSFASGDDNSSVESGLK